MLTPTFHFRILEDFVHVMNEEDTVMVELIKKDKAGSGEWFDISRYITLCSLDIINRKLQL